MVVDFFDTAQIEGGGALVAVGVGAFVTVAPVVEIDFGAVVIAAQGKVL